MLAKKYRLPVQSVLNKRAQSIQKGRYFFVKSFKGEKDFGRFAVVVSKKVNPKANRRNALKRAVFDCIGKDLLGKSKNDILIILQKEAREAPKHAMIEELKKIFNSI